MKSSKEVNITNSELPIMKVLWEKGELTSNDILASLDGNSSTLKTLLKRLVDKGAVGTREITSRAYTYYPIISKETYINQERKGFLARVFDGSKNKMLLNFVKEENISKEDLERLIDMIEED